MQFPHKELKTLVIEIDWRCVCSRIIAGTDILVSNSGNDLSTSINSTEVFTKNGLPNRFIKSFLCAFCTCNVKWEVTHPFGNVNTSAIANNTDCFFWIRRIFLSASFLSERPVTSCHSMLYCFLAYWIHFPNLQHIGRLQCMSYRTFDITCNRLK